MNKGTKIYKPVLQEKLSASEFIKAMNDSGSNIKSSRFIPPVIGKAGDFGCFEVSYKTMVLK